jgi:hypothetical protein
VIPAGIPPRRADWPQDVLRAAARFKQGDLIADVPFFYFADPALPVHALTAEYAGDPPVVCEDTVRLRFALLVSQTCDIVEEDSDPPLWPWVQVCPTYQADATLPNGDHLLNGGERKLIAAGRRQQFVHLTAAPSAGMWVADLRVLLPIEKSVLARRDPLPAFATETERLMLGRRLSYLYSRPAFDGRFSRAVHLPLLKALRKVRTEDPMLWERMNDQISEIGVQTDLNFKMGFVEVHLLHESGAIDDDVSEWFRWQWDLWSETANEAGLTLLPLQQSNLDKLSASTYRKLTRLPLAQVSPDVMWYGPDPYTTT